MVPGMWGAPLKALSGYLPPLETQDFVIGKYAAPVEDAPVRKYDLKMPLGLDGYFTLEEGLEASGRLGKPVFVDITGHGCVNCREMEQRVWSDPRVLQKLRDEFVLVALYTDDKTRLDKSDWVTLDNGTVRRTARAAVRFGEKDTEPVRGMRFDYDAALVERAVAGEFAACAGAFRRERPAQLRDSRQ